MLNKFLRTKFIQAIIAYIAYVYINLVYYTSHWDFKNRAIIDDYIQQKKPFILVFWHGHLFMMACCWRWNVQFNMLISNHRDGRLIAKVVSYFGIKTIVGSTEREGFAAARQIIAKLKQGQIIGITPDGPRGPCEHVSDGVLQLARLGNVDIIPIAYSCARIKELATWDKFRFAKPFCKGVFVAGDPIKPSKDLEQVREAVYNGLQKIVADADNITL